VNIEISYKNTFYNFNIKDILMIKNMENTGIRYLTIKTVHYSNITSLTAAGL